MSLRVVRSLFLSAVGPVILNRGSEVIQAGNR